MNKLSYDNIDFFYYHSTDFDFTRFYSILNNGILSKKAATEKNINFYYRNYTHSSSKDEYISVSHFPLTFLRYYKIENELYDFNRNKICFALDNIDATNKKYYRNRYKYTNERHVKDIIETNSIAGIIIREKDKDKLIKDIAFNHNFTDKSYLENKVFSIIYFYEEIFDIKCDKNKLYYLIGKLREARILNKEENSITEAITRFMNNYISDVFSKLLNIPNPTLIDVIRYINNNRFQIYIMNRYDIKPDGYKLKTTDPRLERIKSLDNESLKEIKEKEKFDKKSMKFIKKLSNYGLDVYFNYSMGPLNEEDSKIVNEIKKLSLKKD